MATRADLMAFLLPPVLDATGELISEPYVKFYVPGTSTAKNAYADKDKAVSFTKKLVESTTLVWGDGIYKLEIYEGDPDDAENPGVLKRTIAEVKTVSVLGNTRTVTASAVTATVDDTLILADTTSNDITVTLPDAALSEDRQIFIQKINSANTVYIAAPSGQTIDNAASVSITGDNASLNPKSDGSNWYGLQAQGNATTLGGVGSSGYVKTDGTNAMTGDLTINAGLKALMLKPASDDHTYMELFARTASPEVRSAYVGYPVAATTTFTIENEETDGDISLITDGTGDVTINGGTAWHSGNDGPGSGLDADTVDGLHFYTGSVTAAGAGNPLPAGWSAVKNSTGWYTVTHSLGTTNYIATMTPINTSAYYIVTFNITTTTFDVRTFINTTATVSDSAFNFILTKY